MSETDLTEHGDEVWGSVQGVIRDGSLTTQEGRIAAIVIGDDGSEHLVEASGDKYAPLLLQAYETGGPVIFRGVLVGPGADPEQRLSVRLKGPAQLNGIVSEIRRSREGEAPRVGIFLLNEMISSTGAVHVFPTGVNVYGADAEALSGLKEGDRVSLEGREAPGGYVAISPVSVFPTEPDGPEEPGM